MVLCLPASAISIFTSRFIFLNLTDYLNGYSASAS